MIPRRLYEHVKTHNWFAVVIDLVIVVVGVFIGLQVANWNEERKERHAARTYIERIREDLATSKRSLESTIKYYQAVRANAVATLDAFDKPPDQLDQQFLIDAYKASQITGGTVERSTYDEIVSTGGMTFIRNIEVRRRLASYYRNVEGLEELIRNEPPYRMNLRHHMPYAVQHAMFERCATEVAVDGRGEVSVTMPATCDLKLPSDTVVNGIAEVRTPELKRSLVHRLGDLDYKLRTYQRLIERGQVLDKFLAEAEL